MRELELDEPAASSTAPSARCSTCRRGPTGGASSSASTRRSGPAAASPGTSSSSTRASPRASTASGRSRTASGTESTTRARQPDRHHARERRHDLALVAEPLRVGRPDRRRRLRGRGALRRLRRTSRSTSPRTSSSGLSASPYDPIARVYDPWWASVTEDVEFYVEEARASGGPVVELAVRHRPDRRAGRQGRRPRHRRRRVGRDARGRARATRAAEGVEELLDLRLGDLREPPVDGARPARPDPVPLAPAHDDRERPAARALGAARELLRPAAGSSSTSSRRREDIEETHGRWLEREPGIFERADWDESERTLTLSVRRGDEASTMLLAWLSPPEWRRCSSAPASRSRRSTAGSTAGPTPAARTSSSRRTAAMVGSAHALDHRSAIVVVLVLVLVLLYNRLVRFRNRVDNAWAQVDVQLKRRYDLIPNLVETVKGYAAHERETFEAVTEGAHARAGRAGPGGAGRGRGHPRPGARPPLRGRRGLSRAAGGRELPAAPGRARGDREPDRRLAPGLQRHRADLQQRDPDRAGRASSPGRSASRRRTSSRSRTRPGRRHASRSSWRAASRRSCSPGTPPPSRSRCRAADVVVQVGRMGR